MTDTTSLDERLSDAQIAAYCHIGKAGGFVHIAGLAFNAMVRELQERRRSQPAQRIGTAADIGCVEPYSCQSAKGDPPMDCIWPDCPCGTLVIKPEYRSQPAEPKEREALRGALEVLKDLRELSLSRDRQAGFPIRPRTQAADRAIALVLAALSSPEERKG